MTIEFDGDGFLYKMVRLMMGALVKCALGKCSSKKSLCDSTPAKWVLLVCRARRRVVSRSRALLIVNQVVNATSRVRLGYGW